MAKRKAAQGAANGIWLVRTVDEDGVRYTEFEHRRSANIHVDNTAGKHMVLWESREVKNGNTHVL